MDTMYRITENGKERSLYGTREEAQKALDEIINILNADEAGDLVYCDDEYLDECLKDEYLDDEQKKRIRRFADNQYQGKGIYDNPFSSDGECVYLFGKSDRVDYHDDRYEIEEVKDDE